jgi:AcrR family transcriptional regulator
MDRLGVDAGMPGSRSANAPERRLPRGRHDLPREFVARTQRDRLIDAMAHTVAAQGYPATSLGDVCAAAGVSTKAFYQHFADKEACFLATFERGVVLLQKSVLSAYGQPGRWPERMRSGLATLLGTLATEPAFASLAVVEVLAAGSRALACRRGLLDSYQQFFAEAPRRAGQPEVPRTAVEAVVAGVYGVIFECVATGRCAELPEHLPDLTYFVLAPFVGRRTAAMVAGTDTGGSVRRLPSGGAAQRSVMT